MSATTKLLDLYRDKLGITSDNAAANALGIHRATVSGWRQRGTQAEAHVLAEMAKAINEEAGPWLALVESERARTAADRRIWAALARRLGAAATVAAVALLLPFSAARADVGANLNKAPGDALCELLRRWARKKFSRLSALNALARCRAALELDHASSALLA